jgi:hypothetical protein
MQQKSDLINGTIQIFDKFDIGATQSGDLNFTPSFTSIGDEYSLSFIDLERVKSFTKFQHRSLLVVPTLLQSATCVLADYMLSHFTCSGRGKPLGLILMQSWGSSPCVTLRDM